MSLLKIENLEKIYGNKDNLVIALNNINLEVNTGEFISIIGPSGSGKSTLLHMIGGVDKPTNGKVMLNGIDIYKMNDSEQSKLRREKISLIYQFYNLIPTLNVKENILFPIMLDNKKIDNNYFEELINILKLNKLLKRFPNELSGGQQQRVAIARALIIKPDIILADEPTGNLDQSNSIEIMKLLKTANLKYNQTIIIVTHDINLASYAKKIITIEDGKIINKAGV